MWSVCSHKCVYIGTEVAEQKYGWGGGGGGAGVRGWCERLQSSRLSGRRSRYGGAKKTLAPPPPPPPPSFANLALVLAVEIPIVISNYIPSGVASTSETSVMSMSGGFFVAGGRNKFLDYIGVPQGCVANDIAINLCTIKYFAYARLCLSLA